MHDIVIKYLTRNYTFKETLVRNEERLDVLGENVSGNHKYMMPCRMLCKQAREPIRHRVSHACNIDGDDLQLPHLKGQFSTS